MPSFLANKVALATLAGLAALPSALAHGHVTSWQIGDTTYAGFNPSNSAELGSTPERATTNSDQGPADYTTDVIATGGTATSSDLVANATAGDTVIVTWNTWPESHKGSVTQWMAHCPDDLCAGTAGADMDWFKISQSSYDESSDSWPTDYIAENLIWTFTLPTNLAAGQYLLRHELLAMHSTGAPQFYPVAIEMQLESSGSTTPSPTGTFPDMYDSDDDMALTQNIYGGSALNAEFVVPGVAVYDGSDSTVSNWDSTGLENNSTSSSSTTASSAVSATTSSAEASAATSSAEVLVATSDAESSIQSSAVETSAVETSAVETSAAETSAVETSAIESSAVESSAVETSAVETSAVETSAAATATNAVSETATSTSASASATGSGSSGTNLQTYTGAIDGISAPSVTADGDQYTCDGNTFNSESDALTRSCEVQRNQCLDSANSKANDEVSSAMTACETQATECDSSISSARRRDMVIGRYARRAF
ncbi:hypothetical protein, variant 2 [Cryptococcus amylolentus CBS 6039]|uniref:lytic cellulose monooxygenase (C4-dehydrogenating) n=2 Tax=Cryptococcus amylolentus TaxID=104669 RepID=A0A1E3HL62_9TREE|nr:hypothetical protein L202_05455 [Cryptococcus amylolentus CBS 6039]XP_018992240.1 hypothetical protein, variant 1 [Cryptococcus amylolentus CBS 6039]XP_018992241.1 hypothetical protein, variant 2 [Cryptococcus amylolentus CBS 6039]ODO04774.1 hypothetical protein I350_05384 [Cryptococcus amylolentus CBS 6273]ODN76865.1 hypothetical protein L202_05455 [Cryptococcus amylolentus CBS 6039]ODN76866.1 hypothetical protein, variant 1 [Cryptococcus amylolentus CBS 6039]ODN76867.1 hypothetical prote